MVVISGTTRLDRHLSQYRTNIADRLESGQTTQSQIDALDESLNLDFIDHAKYQELKSLAMMDGRLTNDEAQQIYIWLGGSPSVFNSRPQEVKALVTKIIAEILAR